mgnify:FL=1
MSHPVDGRRAAAPRVLAIRDGRSSGDPGERRWSDLLGRLEAIGAALQLREKHLDDRRLTELATWIRRRFSGPLILNGRPDLAVAVGADGVHLPADGAPTRTVREMLARHGGACLLGRSCHVENEVAAAAAEGADYVVFGPVFATRSKSGSATGGVDALRRAARHRVPVLALGGISSSNGASALAAGAHGLAAITAFATDSEAHALARLVDHSAVVEPTAAELAPGTDQVGR